MRTRLFIVLGLAALLFTSCMQTDYYEPVFGYDNLPAVIPAGGGRFKIEYEYQYYDTRAYEELFDWEYRIIVDGEVMKIVDITDDWKGSYFVVDIDPNFDDYPKSVLVEVSTHVRMLPDEDYWGDWTPVCSSVQLGR